MEVNLDYLKETLKEKEKYFEDVRNELVATAAQVNLLKKMIQDAEKK